VTDGAGKGRVRRRRLLGGLGATGVAAAVAVFGRSTPASAYNVACCHLDLPPTWSVSRCRGVPHYVWHCWHAGYVRCQCCEAKDPYGATIASAYSCQ
jgi:hypothetical protein